MINEPELIEQLKDPRKREQAFTRLVREYQEPIYWQIRRMVNSHNDADDILQNTFLKAWTAIEAFRGESKLSTWLFRIATNETLNHLNKEKNTQSIDDVSNTGIQLQSDSYFDGDETQIQFQEALSTLPPKQRAVFDMKYFQEMKYEEISQIMGTSIGALKASYHHAVKKITEYFDRLH